MKQIECCGAYERFFVKVDVRLLSSQCEAEYELLLSRCDWAMLYHNLKYRNLLLKFLPTAEAHYFLAFQNGELVGALPSLLTDGPLGPVVNSLPFFGSHGGALLSPSAGPDVFEALACAFNDLCESRGVAFATVIETPCSPLHDAYKAQLRSDFVDSRIGQMTSMPDAADREDADTKLMAIYHQKTRNTVRKALGSDLVFRHECGPEALDALYTLHEENMGALGGVVKPLSFFNAISETMTYDSDYRTYVARAASGKIVSAMLLLYQGSYVEYFVPATDPEWRSAQPLSGLIHYAMRDAVVDKKSKTWNWGGTWLTQDGVYRFKSRWGARDVPYTYFTRVFAANQPVNSLRKSDLLSGYPWFFTLPFSVLTP